MNKKWWPLYKSRWSGTCGTQGGGGAQGRWVLWLHPFSTGPFSAVGCGAFLSRTVEMKWTRGNSHHLTPAPQVSEQQTPMPPLLTNQGKGKHPAEQKSKGTTGKPTQLWGLKHSVGTSWLVWNGRYISFPYTPTVNWVNRPIRVPRNAIYWFAWLTF